MTKKLHLLVFKSYIGPLILTFFISEFILIMQFLWLYIGDLVGKGLDWLVIAELLLYAAAGLVKMALPLAILLASIMTFGNLGENFELSAMKSAGISLQKVMMPLIFLSVFISIGSFFFSNNVIPYTSPRVSSLLYDIGMQNPEMNIKPGVFNNDIEGYSIKIKDKNKLNNMMYDFMIYEHLNNEGNKKVTLADSGTMEVSEELSYMLVTLYGGKTFEEMNEDKDPKLEFPERHSAFDKQKIMLILGGKEMDRTQPELFKQNAFAKPINELQRSKDSLSAELYHKKNRFLKELSQTKYFKYGRRDKHIADNLLSHSGSSIYTVPFEALRTEVNIDSLYESFDVTEKGEIMKAAMINTENTKKYIDASQEELHNKEKNIYKHDVAWHEKFTLAFACLIFFFIGAPLGAIIRKGGFGLPFLVSIIFFIVYYLISMMGRKFVEEGALLPWQGMWLSSGFTLPLGILFTYKATTDSVLFDVTSYLDFIKRPFNALEIKFKDPSIVFHKDVNVPEDKVVCSLIVNLLDESYVMANATAKDLRTKFYGFRRSEQAALANYISNYNSLYNILAIKFRDNKFFYTSLEKFPRIDFEQYELTKSSKLINFLLFTLGLVPFGIIMLFRSKLKIQVLKRKFEMVADCLKTFGEIQDVRTNDK